MPVCESESLGKLWRRGSSGGSSPPSPSSPFSCSPPPGRPHPLPAPLIRSSSSTFTLLDRRYLSPTPPPSPPPLPEEPAGLLGRVLGWYPVFFVRLIGSLLAASLYLSWSQLLLAGPALWLSAWLWLFWKCLRLPLSLAKWGLTVAFTTPGERSRKKRTVLLNGGSTLQTLHLARNFYSAGARVVVFEVEGLFGLARFSTAVDKYYTVPRPRGERAEEYVEAVKGIAAREKALYFVPTSATAPAYYDALVKPHLELQGVTCFCPGLKEVCLLDDASEFLRRCQAEGMATPPYYPVMAKEEVYRLYEDETLKGGRHIMMNSGPAGCRDRMKVLLPPVKREFKHPHYISPQRPWVVLRDYSGHHFVTCTTVKESKVVANVTCRVEDSRGRLVPVEHVEIDAWLEDLFARLKFLRPLSGHMSFRFAEAPGGGGAVLPLGCKVGVSLPYMCHTSVHPRIVWKPCRHFTRQASGPLVAPGGRYWMPQALIDTLRNPSVKSVSRLIGTVVDKREALFAYWDPLPYFAYYHVQLPFNQVLRLVQGRGPRIGFHSPVVANGR